MAPTSEHPTALQASNKAMFFLLSLFLFDWLIMLRLLLHVIPMVSSAYLSAHPRRHHIWIGIVVFGFILPLFILGLLVDLNSARAAYVNRNQSL